MVVHERMGIQVTIFQNLSKRSMTTRWPLTPLLLRSYMCLYTRIIWSKSHENVSKYDDTVAFFFSKTWTKGHWSLDDLWPKICCGHMCDSTQGSLFPSQMKMHQSMWIQWPFLSKTWTKGHWPLDDLWPYICWSHMCDSTQGSLCPSPMRVHQCMWIQWSIFQKLPHTYYVHTYILRTEWAITQSLSELSSGDTTILLCTIYLHNLHCVNSSMIVLDLSSVLRELYSPSEKYLGPKQSPQNLHNDLKKDVAH